MGTKLIDNLTEKLGLQCIDPDQGIFHFPVHSDENSDATLNKMSEIEENGFFYEGIRNIIGQQLVMIFRQKQAPGAFPDSKTGDQAF